MSFSLLIKIIAFSLLLEIGFFAFLYNLNCEYTDKLYASHTIKINNTNSYALRTVQCLMETNPSSYQQNNTPVKSLSIGQPVSNYVFVVSPDPDNQPQCYFQDDGIYDDCQS
jgi:hypothetical protein